MTSLTGFKKTRLPIPTAGDQQMGPRFGPDDFFALQFDQFSKAASPHPVGPRELVLIEGRDCPQKDVEKKIARTTYENRSAIIASFRFNIFLRAIA